MSTVHRHKQQKAELTSTKQKLEESNQTISSLRTRIEQLASRPTHYLDLVADFESNFDRALLAMEQHQHQEQQQSGETSSSETTSMEISAVRAPASQHDSKTIDNYIDKECFYGHEEMDEEDDACAVDHLTLSEQPHYKTCSQGKIKNKRQHHQALKSSSDATITQDVATQQSLLSEMEETKARIDKLETLNSALLHRTSKLEKCNEDLAEKEDQTESKLAMTAAELRSAKAEADHLKLQLNDKMAALAEMQLEIDLVTKASVHANVRANESMKAASIVRTDTKYVQELEAKVTALTEWALASAEAKQLAVGHAKDLEKKLRELEGSSIGVSQLTHDSALLMSGSSFLDNLDTGVEDLQSLRERKLWAEGSSMVIGAGMEGFHLVEFRNEHRIHYRDIISLRWKFVMTPSDMDVVFSIYKGRCEGKNQWASVDALIKNRTVSGGGGGDLEGAFAVQNACTLVWSNAHSWIRPITVKFVVEVYAVTGNDAIF